MAGLINRDRDFSADGGRGLWKGCMFATRIFPGIIIALSIGAGVVYAAKGDAKHAIYWFSAAVLNISVTFL